MSSAMAEGFEVLIIAFPRFMWLHVRDAGPEHLVFSAMQGHSALRLVEGRVPRAHAE